MSTAESSGAHEGKGEELSQLCLAAGVQNQNERPKKDYNSSPLSVYAGY